MKEAWNIREENLLQMVLWKMVHFALFLVKISINFSPSYSTVFFPITVYVSTLQKFQNFITKISKFLYSVLTNKKNCIFNESCALHCWNLSALALLHSDKGMVMRYFQWSGVPAIRTMQCIPMLFLYNALHLYYTPVGLLAWLLILLPYVDPVCQLN
jgi:hypothetical protein